MKMRLFLQKLWNTGKDWDDEMDRRDIEEWKSMFNDLKGITMISIPRHIGSINSRLICFCDASKNAYATVIYLQTTCEGNTKVNLLFSKSRISPKTGFFHSTT